jgi:hypothetical protein
MAGTVLPAFLFFRFFRGGDLANIMGRSYCIVLLAFAFVNFIFYPAILRYQAGTAAGKYAGAFRDQPVYMLSEAPVNFSFEFYSPLPVRRIPADSLPGLVRGGPILVFLPPVYADSLQGKGCSVEMLRRFPNFHISQLTAGFINYRTRDQYLDSVELARVF